MVVRCTNKLARKIKAVLPDRTNKFPMPSEWYADLIRPEGIQYIVATNTGTLATVIFEGSGILSPSALGAKLRQTVTKTFERNGWGDALGRLVDIDDSNLSILPTADRRVLGSLMEMIRLISYHLEDGEKDLGKITDRANETPMSLIGKAPKWLLDGLYRRKT